MDENRGALGGGVNWLQFLLNKINHVLEPCGRDENGKFQTMVVMRKYLPCAVLAGNKKLLADALLCVVNKSSGLTAKYATKADFRLFKAITKALMADTDVQDEKLQEFLSKLQAIMDRVMPREFKS